MNRTTPKRCILKVWLIFSDSNSLSPSSPPPLHEPHWCWQTETPSKRDTQSHERKGSWGWVPVKQNMRYSLNPKQTSSPLCTSPPLSPFLLCHTSPSVILLQGIPVMYVKWVCVSGCACLPSRWSYFLHSASFVQVHALQTEKSALCKSVSVNIYHPFP